MLRVPWFDDDLQFMSESDQPTICYRNIATRSIILSATAATTTATATTATIWPVYAP